MNAQFIKEVRAFNRFYTNIIGLVDRYILHSNYSLPEVRIMYELYHNPNLTASDIIILIDIDKGYLSRIVKKFEKTKLVKKVNTPADKRSVVLQLTSKGEKEFEALNAASDNQVKDIFKNLSEKECTQLIRKMQEIQQILNKRTT